MSVMSQLDLLRSDSHTRCANCGCTEEESGTPVTTIVADWRTELMCDTCVRRYDWSDWTFDPVLNIYTRNPENLSFTYQNLGLSAYPRS